MFEVRADDVVMKSRLEKRPSQAMIDHLAIAADQRGWNGTVLDLFEEGRFLCNLFPSDEAKAQYK